MLSKAPCYTKPPGPQSPILGEFLWLGRSHLLYSMPDKSHLDKTHDWQKPHVVQSPMLGKKKPTAVQSPGSAKATSWSKSLIGFKVPFGQKAMLGISPIWTQIHAGHKPHLNTDPWWIEANFCQNPCQTWMGRSHMLEKIPDWAETSCWANIPFGQKLHVGHEDHLDKTPDGHKQPTAQSPMLVRNPLLSKDPWQN